MNKKIFLSGAAILLALSMSACAGKDKSSSSDSKDDVVLANPDACYVYHGNNQYKGEDGTYVDNGWNGKTVAQYEATTMTAASKNQVKAISEDVYNAIKDKDVKYLYVYTKAVFGVASTSWTTKCMVGDDIYEATGDFAFKTPECTVLEEGGEKIYAESQWIPHDHDMNVESLTKSTLWCSTSFTEEPDEHGFSWDYNPVCIGGAGEYTVILAVYNNASSVDQAGAGLALVRTLEKETDPAKFHKYEAPAENTWGIIGGFEGSGWTTDVAMTKLTDGSFQGEVTLAVDDEWKVRANGKWDVSLGSSAVKSSPEGAFDLTGDNVKTLVAGTYVITLNAAETELSVVAK